MEGRELGYWATYCLIMNTVIGAGVLAIPRAFQVAGVLPCSLILVCVGLLGWLMAREILAVTEKLTLSREPLLGSSSQQWDLPEIVRALLGGKCSLFYFAVITFYFLGTLTAYTNVFGTGFGYIFFTCDYTLNHVTGTCSDYYVLGTVVFGVLVAILAALDYKEQAVFQFVMMCLQLIIVLFVIVYAFYRLSKPQELDFKYIDLDQMGQSLVLIVLAANYHGCFPSILAASQKSHQVMKSVIIAVAASVILVYGSMGVISALAIPDLPPNVSLLLSHEYFGYSETTLPVMLTVLKELVILFPVLDICSNAPILAQALAGIVNALIWGSDHMRFRNSHPFLYRAGRALSMLPVVLLASTSHNFVLPTQASVARFPGLMIILFVLTYVPFCYNRALDSLQTKSSFDLPWRGIRGLNNVLSLGFLCLFLVLLYQRLAQVF